MASNILMNVINVFHEGFHFEKNHVEKVIRVENHFRRGMDFFFIPFNGTKGLHGNVIDRKLHNLWEIVWCR